MSKRKDLLLNLILAQVGNNSNKIRKTGLRFTITFMTSESQVVCASLEDDCE